MNGATRESGATVSSVPLTFAPPAAQRLADVTSELPVRELRGNGATAVSDVTFRSDEAAPGSLFFCVPGDRADGHDFAADAISRGAAALVVERWLSAKVPQVRVPVVRESMGPVSAAFFDHPARLMRTVGVTGTNGKTTVTYLLESILREAGLVAALIGTTGARIGGERVPFARTTPEAPDLQRLLARMVARGVGGVALEVSSHGLDQHRIDGTSFDAAVFTNLSQDHLDYHGTMDEYFAAKARLFTPALAARAAIDIDSSWGERMVEACEISVTTFGRSRGADLRATEVSISGAGVSFEVGGIHVASPLRGDFNVSNCLAAFAAARVLGIDPEPIVRGIAAVANVSGRMERVDAGQHFLVLVDYAHTPEGLDRVLHAARSLGTGRVLIVFGCGGDRDRAKRFPMGRAATAGADHAVITSDNPRSEDPEAIIAEVERGAREGGGSYVVEPDRRTAIRLALRAAEPRDVVVIAGKGHETGQEFAGGSVPFDDRVVAAQELRALQGEAS
jgi:UDP-N-acetylmuramoyl-L-alanyl-D-glutamate--2,6-diaminopimelate ligase